MSYNPTGSPEHLNPAGPEPEVGPAFRYGWEKFKENLGAIALSALVFLVIQAVGAALQYSLTGSANDSSDGRVAFTFNGTALLAQFLFTVVSWIAQLGIIRAALAIVDGRRPEPADLFSVDRFGAYVIASVLLAIGTMIGFVLCVIPGLIFAFLTFFTPYFVLDKRMAPMEAISASISLVRQHLGGFFVFALACFGAFVLGALACLVGLLVAAPVVQIATAYNFRKTTEGPVAA